MTWRSTALASGVTVAGMWVASYAPATRPPAVTSDPPSAAATEAASVAIQREARRLHDRLEHVGSYRQPSRNPFSFAGRRAPAVSAAPEPVIEESVAAAIPQPPTFRMSLAGIAEDTVDGALVRTAVISTPQTVVLAKTGDVVGDRYKVVSIDPASVELARLDDGTIVRLSLKP